MKNFDHENTQSTEAGINIYDIQKPFNPYRRTGAYIIGTRVEAYYGSATIFSKDIWERSGFADHDRKILKTKEKAVSALASVIMQNETNLSLEDILES